MAELYALATRRLGASDRPAPEVVILIGHPGGTNARTYGSDTVTGRTRAMLNVAAHADPNDMRVATV